MADPITLSTLAMAGTAAGAGVGAFGAITGGNAQAGMYEYQQGVAKINQQIQKQNADYARATGEVEASVEGAKNRQAVGGIRAVQGASGVDVGSGSATQVQEGQRQQGEFDQAIIRSNAAKKAYGYEVEATQSEAQANIYGMAAKNSKTAGLLGAFTSILGGATSVAGKWYDATRLGIGTNAGAGVGRGMLALGEGG